MGARVRTSLGDTGGDRGESSHTRVSDSPSRTRGVKQAAGTTSPEPKGELGSKS